MSLKPIFNKNKETENNKSYLVKIAALLIHAAKIDENYSNEEEEIIKKTMIDLGSTHDEIEKLIEDHVEECRKNIPWTGEHKTVVNKIVKVFKKIT